MDALPSEEMCSLVEIERVRDGLVSRFPLEFSAFGSPPCIFAYDNVCLWCTENDPEMFLTTDVLNFYAKTADGSWSRADISCFMTPHLFGLTMYLSFGDLKCAAAYEFPGGGFVRKPYAWSFIFCDPIDVKTVDEIVKLHHGLDPTLYGCARQSVFAGVPRKSSSIRLKALFCKDYFDFNNLVPWRVNYNSNALISLSWHVFTIIVPPSCFGHENYLKMCDCYYALGKTLYKQKLH